jgi:hypothetical protein
MKRRDLLLAAPAALLFSRNAWTANPDHRSYSGEVAYFRGSESNGKERFAVTIQPDGTRIMRAQCEIYDTRVLRDVTVTVDADWMPLVAFIQLAIGGQFAGSTWFNFSGHVALAEGYTAADGRFSQRMELDAPVDAFGTHPIHADAWNLARLRRSGGKRITSERLTSSARSDGGTGPALVRLPANHIAYDLIGPEPVTVPAGTFDARHFTMTVIPKERVIDVWAFGDDCIPALMQTSDERRYELVRLSGDPAR